jgi:lipopolysaccharide biosynthesis glycosyltransferase
MTPMRDIVFAVDDGFVEPFLVALHSLVTRGDLPAASRLYVIHDETLGRGSIDLIGDFIRERGRTVAFVDVAGRLPGSLRTAPTDHVSRATYFRLFAASLLPAHVGSVLYMDCDLLVRKDVRGLLEMPVTAAVAAADHLSPADAVRLHGPLGGGYFQAGVLILNLDAWRAMNAEGDFLRIAEEARSRIRWWDQDILNIAFADVWQRFEIWNNVGFRVVESLPESEVQAHARIVHFDGSHKPWAVDRPRAFRDDWYRAYQEVFGIPFDRRRIQRPFGPRLIAAAKRRVRRVVDALGGITRGTHG